MDTEIGDALYDLKKSIDKQNELQEEANGIMRGLVGVMQGVAQETLELRQHLEKRDGR